MDNKHIKGASHQGNANLNLREILACLSQSHLNHKKKKKDYIMLAGAWSNRYKWMQLLGKQFTESTKNEYNCLPKSDEDGNSEKLPQVLMSYVHSF